MNQNIAGGSSLSTATGGKISDPSVGLDTGIRASSVVDRASGLLTSGGSEAPLDVMRPFDTVQDAVFGQGDPSRVGTQMPPSLGPAGASGILDMLFPPPPGGRVEGAGISGLLTPTNLLLAGGVGFAVWYFLIRKD